MYGILKDKFDVTCSTLHFNIIGISVLKINYNDLHLYS